MSKWVALIFAGFLLDCVIVIYLVRNDCGDVLNPGTSPVGYDLTLHCIEMAHRLLLPRAQLIEFDKVGI